MSGSNYINIQLEWFKQQMRIGDQVFANDKSKLVPDGTPGVIVNFHTPYEDGRTSDVVAVQFSDKAPHAVDMKIKDLYPPGTTEEELRSKFCRHHLIHLVGLSPN